MQKLNKTIKSSHNYLKRIKYLKSIFIIITFVLISLSLVTIGFSEIKEKIPRNNQDDILDTKYRILNLVFTRSFDLVKEYKLFSPQYTEVDKSSILEHPVLHLLDNQSLYTIINAEKGRLFTEEKKLKLSNKIKLIYQERLKLFNDETEVNLNTMTATSNKFTKVTWDESYLNSQKGFYVNLKNKDAKLYGEITGVYYNLDNKVIYFQGEVLEIYNNLNNILLEKKVIVTMEDKKLHTQKLLFDNTQSIITLKDSIRFITAEEEVTAKEGYIDLVTKKLYLNNNVIMQKQNTTVKGQKFIYDYGNNKSSMISDYNKSNKVQIFINK